MVSLEPAKSGEIQKVQHLLDIWKLPELKQKFADEEVTVATLLCIEEHDKHLPEIIPKAGQRIIFLSCLRHWKKEQENLSLQTSNTTTISKPKKTTLNENQNIISPNQQLQHQEQLKKEFSYQTYIATKRKKTQEIENSQPEKVSDLKIIKTPKPQQAITAFRSQRNTNDNYRNQQNSSTSKRRRISNEQQISNSINQEPTTSKKVRTQAQHEPPRCAKNSTKFEQPKYVETERTKSLRSRNKNTNIDQIINEEPKSTIDQQKSPKVQLQTVKFETEQTSTAKYNRRKTICFDVEEQKKEKVHIGGAITKRRKTNNFENSVNNQIPISNEALLTSTKRKSSKVVEPLRINTKNLNICNQNKNIMSPDRLCISLSRISRSNSKDPNKTGEIWQAGFKDFNTKDASRSKDCLQNVLQNNESAENAKPECSGNFENSIIGNNTVKATSIENENEITKNVPNEISVENELVTGDLCSKTKRNVVEPVCKVGSIEVIGHEQQTNNEKVLTLSPRTSIDLGLELLPGDLSSKTTKGDLFDTLVKPAYKATSNEVIIHEQQQNNERDLMLLPSTSKQAQSYIEICNILNLVDGDLCPKFVELNHEEDASYKEIFDEVNIHKQSKIDTDLILSPSTSKQAQNHDNSLNLLENYSSFRSAEQHNTENHDKPASKITVDEFRICEQENNGFKDLMFPTSTCENSDVHVEDFPTLLTTSVEHEEHNNNNLQTEENLNLLNISAETKIKEFQQQKESQDIELLITEYQNDSECNKFKSSVVSKSIDNLNSYLDSNDDEKKIDDMLCAIAQEIEQNFLHNNLFDSVDEASKSSDQGNEENISLQKGDGVKILQVITIPAKSGQNQKNSETQNIAQTEVFENKMKEAIKQTTSDQNLEQVTEVQAVINAESSKNIKQTAEIYSVVTNSTVDKTLNLFDVSKHQKGSVDIADIETSLNEIPFTIEKQQQNNPSQPSKETDISANFRQHFSHDVEATNNSTHEEIFNKSNKEKNGSQSSTLLQNTPNKITKEMLQTAIEITQLNITKQTEADNSEQLNIKKIKKFNFLPYNLFAKRDKNSKSLAKKDNLIIPRVTRQKSKDSENNSETKNLSLTIKSNKQVTEVQAVINAESSKNIKQTAEIYSVVTNSTVDKTLNLFDVSKQPKKSVDIVDIEASLNEIKIPIEKKQQNKPSQPSKETEISANVRQPFSHDIEATIEEIFKKSNGSQSSTPLQNTPNKITKEMLQTAIEITQLNISKQTKADNSENETENLNVKKIKKFNFLPYNLFTKIDNNNENLAKEDNLITPRITRQKSRDSENNSETKNFSLTTKTNKQADTEIKKSNLFFQSNKKNITEIKTSSSSTKNSKRTYTETEKEQSQSSAKRISLLPHNMFAKIVKTKFSTEKVEAVISNKNNSEKSKQVATIATNPKEASSSLGENIKNNNVEMDVLKNKETINSSYNLTGGISTTQTESASKNAEDLNSKINSSESETACEVIKNKIKNQFKEITCIQTNSELGNLLPPVSDNCEKPNISNEIKTSPNAQPKKQVTLQQSNIISMVVIHALQPIPKILNPKKEDEICESRNSELKIESTTFNVKNSEKDSSVTEIQTSSLSKDKNQQTVPPTTTFAEITTTNVQTSWSNNFVITSSSTILKSTNSTQENNAPSSSFDILASINEVPSNVIDEKQHSSDEPENSNALQNLNENNIEQSSDFIEDEIVETVLAGICDEQTKLSEPLSMVIKTEQIEEPPAITTERIIPMNKSPISIQKEKIRDDWDVEQILKKRTDGRAVLKYQIRNSFLNDRIRVMLVDILIRNVNKMKIRKPKKLDEIFLYFTEQIKELFPNEKVTDYYCPEKPRNGKFWDRYKYYAYKSKLTN